MTIPQNNSMTGNIRGQHARHEYNSHGNIISNASQQHNSANGVISHLDDHIPNLSSRFAGTGRQSSLSQASGGVTVSEGNVFDSYFYYPSILLPNIVNTTLLPQILLRSQTLNLFLIIVTILTQSFTKD